MAETEPTKDNRFKTLQQGDAIPIPPPSSEEIIDAVYRSKDRKLLSAVGRATDKKRQWPFPLVWQQPIALYEGDYVLAIFDYSLRMEPGRNPRVLVLMDLQRKIVTWGSFTCEPMFGFASIVQSHLDKETQLITVNPSSRSGGELWFERYKIEPTGITKLGEGNNPSELKKAGKSGGAKP